jgi:putative membrane protein
MTYFMWLLRWMLKAAIFFTLLAFALNNQQDVQVHFLLGRQWTAPLVAVLLAAFALGIVAGVLGMAPHWWRQRRLARPAGSVQASAAAPAPQGASVSDGH